MYHILPLIFLSKNWHYLTLRGGKMIKPRKFLSNFRGSYHSEKSDLENVFCLKHEIRIDIHIMAVDR